MSGSILPKELQGVWDDETAQLFSKLTFPEQTFCLDYLKHGVGGRAYLKAYPNTKDKETAYALASRKIRDVRVAAFLEKFRESTVEDYFLVHRGARRIASGEVIETELNGSIIPQVPNIDQMLKAQQVIAKLSGLNAPEKVQDDRFSLLIQQIQKNREPNGQDKTGSI